MTDNLEVTIPEVEERAQSLDKCFVLVHPMFAEVDSMEPWEKLLKQTYLGLAKSLKDKPNEALVVVLFEDTSDRIKKQIRSRLNEVMIPKKIKEILGKNAIVITSDLEAVDEDDHGVFAEKLKYSLKNRGFKIGRNTNVVVGGEASAECVKFMTENLARSLELQKPVTLDLNLTEVSAMEARVTGAAIRSEILRDDPKVSGKISIKDKE